MTKLYQAGDGGPMTWVFLSNGGGFDRDIASRTNILESFYYIADWQTRNMHRFKSFILDSGAYTFRQNSKKSVDWNDYLRQYAEYVKEHNVERFFDLDIDGIVGYDNMLKLRRNLESIVGRQCTPVWHHSYGKQAWLDLCDEYDYVAIGGIAGKNNVDITKYLPWFTKEAHKRGTKVHGLGYTRLIDLQRCNFDSVDSTAWLYGNMAGYVYVWDGRTMQKVNKPSGKKLDSKRVARHNFMEWVKMAEDMERR